MFLVINSNIDAVKALNEIVDDRVRAGEKKKGSIDSECYEIFLTTEDELSRLLTIIENNYRNGNR